MACRHGRGHLRHYINMQDRLKCPGVDVATARPRLSLLDDEKKGQGEEGIKLRLVRLE